MKIRSKINLLFFCTAALLTLVFYDGMKRTIQRIQSKKSSITITLNTRIGENVNNELAAQAETIAKYVSALEFQIDRNMKNAAAVVYETDRLSPSPLTSSELERIRKETGMSGLYLTDRNGTFIASTEPKSIGMSLFDISDGYRALLTGQSEYIPSPLIIKAETGEIFKFTAVPRANGRGIIESAFSAEDIEQYLQAFMTKENGITSILLISPAGLVLTENRLDSTAERTLKGTVMQNGKLDIIVGRDYSQFHGGPLMTLDERTLHIYYPITENSGLKYVLYMEVDIESYYTLSQLVNQTWDDLVVSTQSANFTMFIVLLVIVALCIVFGAFLIGRLLQPLSKFSASLESLAGGNFTEQIPDNLCRRKDEVGEMGRSFKVMTQNVGTMIKSIKSASEVLTRAGESLAANAEETQAQVQSIGGHILSVSDKADRQSGSVETASSSIEEIAQNIESLDGVIAGQASAVDQSSTAITGMIDNIAQVNTNLAQINRRFDSLVDISRKGLEKQEETDAQIQGIVNLSETLTETNTIIANIASQTNLLAMNAAIEAAHAGDAGKGFAVVSDEIRKLAEDSGVQSKTIGEQLAQIQRSIGSIVSASQESKQVFDSIAEQIDVINALVEQTSDSVASQSESSRHILQDIKDITSVTGEVKSGAAEMRIGSETIVAEMLQLKDISAEVRANMAEVSGSVSQIGQAAETVLDVALETKHSIGDMTRELDKFII